MKTIRTLIVEDEYHPRLTLQQKLAENHPEIEVIAACENAETALIEILRLQPDLIFLDIQLPDKNGLWLADQLHGMTCATFTPPGIIFTTAFSDSEYLFNAIRLAAIDYLVKPIMLDSLSLAIGRFKKRTNPSASVQTLMNVIQSEKILRFKNFNGLLLLKPEDIAYIEADGNYARITLANGDSDEIFERLGEIEKTLPSETFVRAGKSLIVNQKYVRQINVRKYSVQITTPFVSQ
ncbi:MAG: LytTR family DNA-binding domain-containing protein, partial [Candidatus Symbiothrix sp.]|nr:LytTR family DNA-binding domain-containing protein [Candidatus Symbiothrix sp.]